MKRLWMVVALVLAASTLVSARTSSAREIDFLEDFVLAPDRTVPLGQLIPGTEDYYYYHCLHFQNRQQFDRVDELLKAWIKRHKYTARVREIQHRQALRTYAKNPQAALAHLRSHLNLTFNHQREIVNRKPALPIALDQALIGRPRLMAEALKSYQNTDGFEASALYWLANENIGADRRRHLLSRLQRPDVPNLAELVVADLRNICGQSLMFLMTGPARNLAMFHAADIHIEGGGDDHW